MNIFLPYEDDIQKSVESLDDKRLNKQILECYQLLLLATDEKAGVDISKRGYRNHPIYLHYKNYPDFIGYYGYLSCLEYQQRFDKEHKLKDKFVGYNVKYILGNNTYKPFYMEGSKGQPNYIRTTDDVSYLYQCKLINKWINSKHCVVWTRRDVPEFLQQYIKNS